MEISLDGPRSWLLITAHLIPRLNYLPPTWLHHKCIAGTLPSINWLHAEFCFCQHCDVIVQRMEENRIPKRVLCMNLGTTGLRGRPRNRWQDGVREDGRIVGGEEWQEKVRTDRNGRSS